MCWRNLWRTALFGVVFLLSAAIGPARGADWTNSGGNAGRNGLSLEIGPLTAELAWSASRTSIIAWLPVTEGERVFSVRQVQWPYQQPNDAYVVAQDLLTGEELWAVVLPYEDGDWTPWIAGVMGGKVYASRGGNGATVAAPVYALDVTDGDILWVSEDEVDAGAYDGVVFAPNGDLLVGSFHDIWRISALDGSTVWHASRTGSVSGNCGGAMYGDAFYVADVAPNGHVLVRYDLDTGAREYESPLMPGFLTQTTPMVGPDGTVYFNRAQNNPAVDFYYAFDDDGAQFTERWIVPGMGGASSEFGVGPDGSVYFILEGPSLARLDPETGAVLNKTGILDGFSKPRIAIDAQGKVFMSNGAFATGRLYAYDADLTPRWDAAVTNINIGGPSLGEHGILVVCGVGTDMRAYLAPDPAFTEEREAIQTSGIRLVCTPSLFHDRTVFNYRLPNAAVVALRVYDASGRCVRTLAAERLVGAGDHHLLWCGRDDGGRLLPSGTYHYSLEAGNDRAGGRAILLR